MRRGSRVTVLGAIGLTAVVCLLSAPRARADDQKPSAPPQTESRETIYVVQPGDTCSSIAEKVWPNDPENLERLHDLNPMGPLPHKLVPGQRLRLVSNIPDATLSFVKPDVNVRKSGAIDWLHAAVGEGLFHLDQVSTLAGAAAEVLFKDQSTLQLDQNALVVIYGAFHGTRSPERSGDIELVQGDLRLHLAKLSGEGAKDVSVATPGAKVSARSRNIAVNVDEKKMSRVSVFDGRAAVAALGSTVEVREGFGTRVANGKPPEAPQLLPAAPSWAAETISEYASLTPKGVGPVLAWRPVDDGVRYRLEVATDHKFNSRVLDATYPAADRKPTLTAVVPGHYFARVSAYNAAGLVGPASEVRPLHVAKVQIVGGTIDPQGKSVRGVLEVGVSLPGSSGVYAWLDGKQVNMPFVVEGIGAHTVKFALKSGAVVGEFPCQIDPPRATVKFNKTLTKVLVEFYDSTGNPAAVSPGHRQDLYLQGLEGTEVGVLLPVGKGHQWVADIKPTADGEAFVQVLWNQQMIGFQRAYENSQ